MSPAKRTDKRDASSALNEDGSFPRGGGGGSAAPSGDQAMESYEKGGFLGTGGGERKSKKMKTLVDDEELGLFSGAGDHQGKSGKLPKFVELLKLKGMSVGMKVWGAVLEISHRELTICLPHGLRGTVALAEASDVICDMMAEAFKSKDQGGDGSGDSEDDDGAEGGAGDAPAPPALGDAFQVGQLVKCVVLDIIEKGAGPGMKKGIQLSCRLSKVNAGLTVSSIEAGTKLSACVRSQEDHGYVLALGPRKIGGFLLHKDHAGPPLVTGALVECVATAVDKARRRVSVTTDPSKVASCALTKSDGVTLEVLQPGSLVQGKVKAVLGDGLVVTFLTYFTGTVDPFHLPQAEVVGPKGLAGRYKDGQKVRARVLYVDPATKRVGLSLIDGLLAHALPTTMPPVGYVSSDARVLRVDEGLGLLLKIPAPEGGGGAEAAFGYCHLSNLSDSRVDKVGKTFKAGQTVKARVIAYRPMDHLCTMSCKRSVVEAQLLGYEDCHPGLVVKGTVAALEDFGALIDITDTIRALCPTAHLSDVVGKRTAGKFKVGAHVSARVLDCRPGDRKLTVTLKKQLVTSDLPLVRGPLDLAPGLVTHGMVTGAREFGVFVQFYGGVKGLAHATQCGLPPGQLPAQAFEQGQVVKVRVVGVGRDGKVELSLLTSKAAIKNAEKAAKEKGGLATGETEIELGATVSGRVREVRPPREEGGPSQLVLEVRDGQNRAGIASLDGPHLSDHPTAAAALEAAIKPGAKLEGLLVCERADAGGAARRVPLRVTRKASLVAAGAAWPSGVSGLAAGAVVPGYVASVAPDAVFVRFQGRFTCRVPKTHLADTFVSDAGAHYVAGQSVRAFVQEVTGAGEAARAKLSLKQSLCASSDASLLRTLLEDLELARSIAEGGEEGGWPAALAPGALVDGSVADVKEYGVLIDIDGHDDVVGFATHRGAGGEGTKEAGDTVRARVLDVNRAESIVDLSLLPHLTGTAAAPAAKGGKKKAGSRKGAAEVPSSSSSSSGPAPGERADARVELVKDDYLVLSFPGHPGAVAYAPAADFNLRPKEMPARLLPGKAVEATGVGGGAAPGGRALCTVPLADPASAAAAPGSARKKKVHAKDIPVGTIVLCKVERVDPLECHVAFTYEGAQTRGRVHISNLADPPKAARSKSHKPHSPMSKVKEGDEVEAVVLGEVKGEHRDWRHSGRVDLSARPAEVVACARKGDGEGGAGALAARPTRGGLAHADLVHGWVAEVAGDDHLWVAVTPAMRGRVDALDANLGKEAGKPGALAAKYSVGQPVECYTVGAAGGGGAGKKALDLSMTAPGPDAAAAAAARGKKRSHEEAASSASGPPVPGTVRLGRVIKVMPGQGIRVALSQGGGVGRVYITDVSDTPLPDLAKHYKVGTVVQAYVLAGGDVAKGNQLDLSLRESRGGGPSEGRRPKGEGDEQAEIEGAGDLKAGQEVAGFVKSINRGGCFVALGRGVDARIKMSQLSDGYVADPAAEFPPGRLVRGRVVSADKLSGRVEMSLKSEEDAPSGLKSLEDIVEGGEVKGRVKRVETYGVFVAIDDSGVTGMCHISEASDEFVKDLSALFAVGDRVRAKVTKVDRSAGRLSLALRESALEGGGAAAEGGAKGQKKVERADEDESEEEEEEEEKEEEEGMEVEGSEDEEGAGVDDEDESDDEEDDVMEEEEEEEEEESEEESEGESEGEEAGSDGEAEEEEEEEEGGGLAFGGGMKLDGDGDGEEGGEGKGGEDEGEGEGGKPLSKREKRKIKAAKEQDVRDAEEARLAGDSVPESAEEFERLVMASPSSSFVWIKYMAFNVSCGEYEKARRVAERALESINRREDGERLNVWVAWLNLENLYGAPTPAEAVAALFQRALPHTDQKKLHLAMVGILENTEGREELAATVFRSMTRKFPGSCKVWLRNMAYLLAADDEPGARKLLDKALGSVPRRKHVKLITQAALLEFRQGSAERARGIMEGVLRNYPKRTDLWSVYIDQEVKIGDAARTRALLERATHLDLGPRKMKFLFKKYLEYERAQGDEERVEHVKQRAMEYVQSRAE